jgi:hypothetical protein
MAKTNREQSLIVHALFGKHKVMTPGKNAKSGGRDNAGSFSADFDKLALPKERGSRGSGFRPSFAVSIDRRNVRPYSAAKYA